MITHEKNRFYRMTYVLNQIIFFSLEMNEGQISYMYLIYGCIYTGCVPNWEEEKKFKIWCHFCLSSTIPLVRHATTMWSEKIYNTLENQYLSIFAMQFFLFGDANHNKIWHYSQLKVVTASIRPNALVFINSVWIDTKIFQLPIFGVLCWNGTKIFIRIEFEIWIKKIVLFAE